ncbi:MAG: GGDEF domain-containing protein [Candidatus Coproplasma sp.]
MKISNINKQFILNSIWNNCYKIARVNVLDGRYSFIKKIVSAEEEKYLTAPTITEYVQRIIDGGWVYPEDTVAYRRMVQPEYLRETIFKRRIPISDTFRRLIVDKYCWMTMETMIPDDFSEKNPWVLFLWKDADSQAGLVTDSMRMLARLYYKIVKVDITTGVFDVVKEERGLVNNVEARGNFFTDYSAKMIKNGLVYSEDIKSFTEYFNSENLIKIFGGGAEESSCTFRRLFGNEYRWVKTYVYRSYEYSENNKVVLMYIRDVNKQYMTEIKHHKELEYLAEHDELTGLGNRRKFNEDSARQNEDKCSAGVFYADLNSLKFYNDNFGHSHGDRFILGFSNVLKKLFGVKCCYRISGDEFVVIFRNITQEQFIANYAELEAEMAAVSDKISEYGVGNRTVASIGCAWEQSPESLDAVVAEAEADMYDKKAVYYQVNPEFKRI